MPPPGERVQIERLGRDEGLALTGLHLGDVALVEDDAAHQLDVEEAHADRALERLPDRRERLEEDVVEVLAVLDALLELDRLRGELVVGQLLELGLERADVARLLGEALEAPAFAEAENLFEAAELLRRAQGTATPRGRRPDLPEVAVQAFCVHGELRPSRSPRSSRAGSEPKTWLPVDGQLDRPVAVGEVDRVAAGRVRKLEHLDPARLDAPTASRRGGRRARDTAAQLLLDRAASARATRRDPPRREACRRGARRTHGVRPRSSGRIHGDDRVPARGREWTP